MMKRTSKVAMLRSMVSIMRQYVHSWAPMSGKLLPLSTPAASAPASVARRPAGTLEHPW